MGSHPEPSSAFVRPGRRFVCSLASLQRSIFCTLAAGAFDEGYKIAKLADAAPDGVSSEIKKSLDAKAYRVTDGSGKPLVDLWLRKRAPATGKPEGSKAAVLYPVLTEGELIGAAKVHGELHDYRDQPIKPGVYTLRYGLQPINGAHLGVSTYRDYLLMVPAGADSKLENLASKVLQEKSAESAGTSHPAVLLMQPPPEKPPVEPEMAHDESLNTWGAVVTLPLSVKGDSAETPMPIHVVVVGIKMD